MIYVIYALAGYLLGSINASIIISKIKGTDIRKHGSKNAGATNTLRTFGAGAAACAVLVDILKGIAAVLVARYFSDNNIIAELVSGFAAILGHNYPVYFGFRGGKGVLTSFAVAVAISPVPSLIALAVGVLVIAVTRYVSLGSMLGAVTLAVISLFMSEIYIAVFMVVLTIIIIARHYQNIGRLLRGEERKLGEKSK